MTNDFFKGIRLRPIVSLLVYCTLIGAPLTSQDSQSLFQTASHEVLLDVLIHDKHGHSVRDISSRDLQVYEDGRRQDITSLRLIDPNGAYAPSPSVVVGAQRTPAADGSRDVRLVSLVFDRLSPGEQRNARIAVQQLLATAIPKNTYIAIFVLDRSLYLLQPFTSDPGLLKNAATRATSGLPSQYIQDSKQNLIQLEELYLKHEVTGLDRADIVMLRTLRDEVRAARSDRSRAQMEALLSLVRYQDLLPGRKAVIYLSAGLIVPSGSPEPFNDVVASANRARVSFYTLDVRGVEGTQTAAPSNRLVEKLQSGEYSRAEWQPETLHSEVNATRMALEELAKKTGGVFSSTNDATTALEQFWRDLHTYYELTYKPSWNQFDGKFHQVAVHSLRHGISVQSRDGYYALPIFAGRTMLPYESDLLKALNRRPLPRSLTLSAAIVCYRASKTDRCVLAISTPLSELVRNQAATLNAAQLAFVALIHNSANEVIDVVSHNFTIAIPQKTNRPVSEPLGDFTRIERFDVPPGRYTIDIGIEDRRSLEISGKRVSLYVPAFKGLDASELIRVRSLTPHEGSPEDGDPLDGAAGRITPDPCSTFRRNSKDRAALYCLIYPGQNGDEKVNVIATIVGDDGRAIRSEPSIVASSGRVRSDRGLPYLVSFSAEGLNVGNYILRLTIQQSANSIQRLYPFTVAGTY